MEEKTEVVKNSLNGKSSTLTIPSRRGEPVHVVKGAPAEEKRGEAKEPKPKTPKKTKSPHVGVDFTMPTLKQVAEFVAAEAKKGTKTLTATEIRNRFKVPGKIPMNTRMIQLQRGGYGTLSKVGKSNTFTIDIEAIKSGKAKIGKPKPEKKVEGNGRVV
jgi:hypothetical protein